MKPEGLCPPINTFAPSFLVVSTSFSISSNLLAVVKGPRSTPKPSSAASDVYKRQGYYYEPTVFDDVKDNFTIMREEPFGPLVPILTFKTFDEVIERANDNDLGLCSYLYTNSMDKAHIGSEKLESGCVAVNTGVVAIAEAPFGGIKQTGYGREGGSGAIKDYLNVKYTHMGLKI